jgi:hypothetical protein
VESEEISKTMFFGSTLTGLIARENFSVYSLCIGSGRCYRWTASKGNRELKREEFPGRRRELRIKLWKRGVCGLFSTLSISQDRLIGE